MAIIDDETEGRGYPLPNAANKLKDDVVRLRIALAEADGDVTALLLALASKADTGHVHGIGDVTGLTTALDGKLAVGYHDTLGGLADVSVSGAANGQVLIKQGEQWIPIALQVGNIVNLETLLSGKAAVADLAAKADAAAVATALAGKAPLASPPLTGTPTAPTAPTGTDTTQVATTAFVQAAVSSSGGPDDAKWLSKGIGERYSVDDSMAGADVPPTDNPAFRFVKLTAGIAGPGAYNDGILTGETISGTAPKLLASAVISLAGSPLNGQRVSLLNTERRFSRPGIAGVLQEGTLETHGHTASFAGNPVAPHTHTFPSGSTVGSDTNTAPRATLGAGSTTSGSAGGHTPSGTVTVNATGDTETTPRNIGVTEYMRVK